MLKPYPNKKYRHHHFPNKEDIFPIQVQRSYILYRLRNNKYKDLRKHKEYKTLADAIAAAKEGDTIVLDAGNYEGAE